MYGAIFAYKREPDNSYHKGSLTKPSPFFRMARYIAGSGIICVI
jgi:hypothetical protein